MSVLDDFERVTRNRPCPICHKPDWCLVSTGSLPIRAVCQRVESAHRWGEAGWLHIGAHGMVPAARRTRTVRIAVRTLAPDMTDTMRRFLAGVERPRLRGLAGHLRVSVESLERLGVGWTGSAWAFPMIDPSRPNSVCGIRLRRLDHTKTSMPGGREGLFVPAGVARPDLLLLAEGPSDTAALLDAGFHAVGRPSCSGGRRQCATLVRAIQPTTVVVVADADGPGQVGAELLLHELLETCRDVRVVTPPAKDVRDWLVSGAGPRDVAAAIEAAERPRLRLVVRRAPR